MLRNYLTIALRNLWRNRLYTALNIAGLAVGISACVVIYLLASFELSFDRFHPARDRIYRVYSQFTGTFGGVNHGVTAPLPVAIRQEVTGIETVAAFHTQYLTVSTENKPGKDKVFKEQSNVILAEPQYFEVFNSYQWLAGSPKTALNEPFQVVLTESKAQTYFGVTDATEVVGRTLHYNDSLTVTVSGVVKDLPKTSDLYFTDFISFATIRQSWLKKNIDLDDSWGSTNSASQAWIKLLPGVQPARIDAQLRKIADQHREGEADGGSRTTFHLQALSDLHFNPQLGIFDSSRAPVHLVALRLLIVVALLLLLIAAINFINLVTAQAVKRAKEVGVRKVLGSTRRELVFQFLSETLLITTFAVLLSIGIASFSLQFFEEFIPDGVALRLTDPFIWLFLLLTTLVVSLLSGLYPAFVLSSFEPVQALKSQFRLSSGKNRVALLRQSLIVFQFAFAQILIVGTFIVGSQIDFMLNKDMGFTKDAVVYFSTPYNPVKDQRAVMKQQLARLPGVTAMSMHNAPPAANSVYTNLMEFNKGKEVLEHNVHQKYGDSAYIHLYEIPLLAGRNLQPSDTTREFLINETYARQLGFERPEQAVGNMIHLNEKPYPIAGVVKDFHVRSLHEPVPPVTISSEEKSSRSRTFGLKLSTQGKGVQDFQETIAEVQKIWQQLYPEYDFTYTFLDESIAKFYEAEQRMRKLASTATGIAIFISCLGLFGLATYTAEQRTKEIGIRKVLGASVQNIVTLLSKGFVKLVLLALVVATPIAWFAISKWLENFAYPVVVRWWMFALPGVLALLIALLTVSYQAIKAALANPVESLRSE